MHASPVIPLDTFSSPPPSPSPSRNVQTTKVQKGFFLVRNSILEATGLALEKCRNYWGSEVIRCLENCNDYAFFRCFLVKCTKIHCILNNFELKNRENLSNFWGYCLSQVACKKSVVEWAPPPFAQGIDLSRWAPPIINFDVKMGGDIISGEQLVVRTRLPPVSNNVHNTIVNFIIWASTPKIWAKIAIFG